MKQLHELKAAVVGTGFIGAVHVDALRRLGIEILGVVGSTPERARATSSATAYDSFESVLADERVDVIHLATPNDLHHPQAKQALEAGKHVVCEKPLAVTCDQSAELVELAERSGLVHCTNFNLRFYPLVQEARERVQAGAVGEIWSIHVTPVISPLAPMTSPSSGSGTSQEESERTPIGSPGPTVRRQPASLRKSSGRSAS